MELTVEQIIEMLRDVLNCDLIETQSKQEEGAKWALWSSMENSLIKAKEFEQIVYNNTQRPNA